MSLTRFLLVALFVFFLSRGKAQSDSIVHTLQEVPLSYIGKLDDKIEKYNTRLTKRTEKALVKLSKWEGKIQLLLKKVNPQAAQRLFGNNQTTFTTLLNKIKEGKSIAENYRVRYDEYRDKLTTQLKYLDQQKDKLKDDMIRTVAATNKKIKELDEDVKNSDALEQFIKKRKKELIDEGLKYIGKSKYLMKINKESYYYIETVRNYKEIFNDKKKAEETVFTVLNNIPAYKKFAQQNSLLVSLFPMPANYGGSQSLAGLQTRAGVNNMMQARIASGGPNARQQVSQNIQEAQAQLNSLKEKVFKAGGNNSDMMLADFKPNNMKTKTFKQRLEFGSNFQFSKPNGYLPTTADIGFTMGYKLSEKAMAGIGASYKVGFGTIQHISITHQGLGARSFIDWKLKKQFFLSVGFEFNYNAQFKNIEQLKNFNDWQQSALFGLSKKLNVKSKFIKGTKFSILYDFLAKQHIPTTDAFLFRIGYGF